MLTIANSEEEAFISQQASPSFSVPFYVLGADIRLNVLAPGKMYKISGMQAMEIEQNHPGRHQEYAELYAGTDALQVSMAYDGLEIDL